MYLWDLDHGFAGVILIKKAGDGSNKIKGCWDSIHVVEVQVCLNACLLSCISCCVYFVHCCTVTVNPWVFTRESSYCFRHILAIAILSVCLSVRHTGGSVKNAAS